MSPSQTRRFEIRLKRREESVSHSHRLQLVSKARARRQKYIGNRSAKAPVRATRGSSRGSRASRLLAEFERRYAKIANAQVCTELDNHLGLSDRTLAEFIMHLAAKHPTPSAFSKARQSGAGRMSFKSANKTIVECYKNHRPQKKHRHRSLSLSSLALAGRKPSENKKRERGGGGRREREREREKTHSETGRAHQHRHSRRTAQTFPSRSRTRCSR